MEIVTAEVEVKERMQLDIVFESKKLGKISKLERLTNGSNDRVYKVDRESDLPLILKIFKSKNEPNREAFSIVNKLLLKKNILTVDVLLIEAPSEVFPTGFMLTEFVEGIDAEDAIKEGKFGYPEYYSKLGALMKQVHSITFSTFGIIGEVQYPTYIEYMKTRLAISYGWTRSLNLFTSEEEKSISEYILNVLGDYSRLPGVLTHGDISPNNCRLTTKGELVLIDWGDGMSSQNWIYDFSIMTYWMYRIHENTLGDWEKYRSIFLKEYGKNDVSDSIRKVESAIHIFQSIGLLAYYKEDQETEENYKYTVKRFIELMKEAKLDLPVSFK